MESQEHYDLKAMTTDELQALVTDLEATLRPMRQRCGDVLMAISVGIGLTVGGLLALWLGRVDIGFPLTLTAMALQSGIVGVVWWEDWQRAKRWAED